MFTRRAHALIVTMFAVVTCTCSSKTRPAANLDLGAGDSAGDSSGDPASDVTGGAKFDHLVMILMENHGLADIYGPATFMTRLADGNVLLTNYTAVDHPSEPNYLAIAAGQTFNPPSGDDGYHTFAAINIVDRLESAGLTWRAYSESAAGPCDKTNPDVRHVPFIFFADVAGDAARCNRIVRTTPNTDDEFIAELNSATASNFLWLTPNDVNNMHSASVATGDAYLAALVPRILSSKTFTTRSAALFIVFDEGGGKYPSDLLYAVWVGADVKKAQKFTTFHSHYSVLATLEANWGFAPITAQDGAAAPMIEVFR